MCMGRMAIFALSCSLCFLSQASAQGFGNWYIAGSLTGDNLITENQSSLAPGPMMEGPFSWDSGGRQSDTTSNSGFGFAFGGERGFGGFQLRLEGEGRWYENSSFTTSGMMPAGDFGRFPPEFDERDFDEFFEDDFFEEFEIPSIGPSLIDVTDRWSGMFNLWIDKPLFDLCEIYAGGGMGASGFSLETSNTGLTNTDFAYQLGVGLGCSLLSNLQLDLGYRYIDLGNADLAIAGRTGDFDGPPLPSRDVAVDFHTHQVQLSLRYYFR